MKFGFAAVAAAVGLLLAGAAPVSAADASGSTASVSYESSMETTQGRRGGSFRGGGGGGFRAVGGGGGSFRAVGGGRSFGGRGPRRGNFGRNVAIGVGAALVGGIIANEVYRSGGGGGGGNSCSRWNWRCNNGEGWACRQFDRYC